MNNESVKSRFRIPAFWQGVLVVVIAYPAGLACRKGGCEGFSQ